MKERYGSQIKSVDSVQKKYILSEKTKENETWDVLENKNRAWINEYHEPKGIWRLLLEKKWMKNKKKIISNNHIQKLYMKNDRLVGAGK